MSLLFGLARRSGRQPRRTPGGAPTKWQGSAQEGNRQLSFRARSGPRCCIATSTSAAKLVRTFPSIASLPW